MTSLPPVAALLPHTPPSLLIEELLTFEADRAVARLRITPSSLFFEAAPAGVPAIVGLEYMAQTIAALEGARRHRRGLAPQLGALVGCRLLSLAVDRYLPGDELQIEARQLGPAESFDAPLGQFACAVLRAGLSVAQGVLSVYRGPLVGPALRGSR